MISSSAFRNIKPSQYAQGSCVFIRRALKCQLWHHSAAACSTPSSTRLLHPQVDRFIGAELVRSGSIALSFPRAFHINQHRPGRPAPPPPGDAKCDRPHDPIHSCALPDEPIGSCRRRWNKRTKKNSPPPTLHLSDSLLVCRADRPARWVTIYTQPKCMPVSKFKPNGPGMFGNGGGSMARW